MLTPIPCSTHKDVQMHPRRSICCSSTCIPISCVVVFVLATCVASGNVYPRTLVPAVASGQSFELLRRGWPFQAVPKRALILRGGYEVEGPDVEEPEPPHTDEEDEVEGFLPHDCDDEGWGFDVVEPRTDVDVFPWIVAFRQAWFEQKLHNRTALRKMEASGMDPPFHELFALHDLPELPNMTTWKEYWEVWQSHWHSPPDHDTNFMLPRYRYPHVTDEPPEIGIDNISVTEDVVTHGMHYPDSFPPGWPEVLDDVLDDNFDEVERVMHLNYQLLVAARDGDLERVVSAVKEGALVHAADTNNYDMTPLHHAAYRGHTQICQVLVQELGAEVDRQNLGGETALFKAVSANRTDTCEQLLQLGADPNHRTGRNPYSQALGELWAPLHRAALLGLSEVIDVLVRHGADVDALSRTHWTPLHYAAAWAHLGAVEALLAAGADPLRQTRDGRETPLDKALRSRFVPDTAKVKMRTLYAAVAEVLKEKMRERLAGEEPVANILPHWHHGNLSAAEVEAAVKAEHAHFLNGSWIQAWREEAGLEAPHAEELLEVMKPWIQEEGVEPPVLQAVRYTGSLRGGGGEEEVVMTAGIPEDGAEQEGAGKHGPSTADEEWGRGDGESFWPVEDEPAPEQEEEEGGDWRARGEARELGMEVKHVEVRVWDRTAAVKMLRDGLGMRVLRHEELDAGNNAPWQRGDGTAKAATGSIAGRWSVTVLGYGEEAEGFTVHVVFDAEAAMRVGVDAAADHGWSGRAAAEVEVRSRRVFGLARLWQGARVGAKELANQSGGGMESSTRGAKAVHLLGPGGLVFKVVDTDERRGRGPFRGITLPVENLVKAVRLWGGVLGMERLGAKDGAEEEGVATMTNDRLKQVRLVLRQEDGDPKRKMRGDGVEGIGVCFPSSWLPAVREALVEEEVQGTSAVFNLDLPGRGSVPALSTADGDGRRVSIFGEEEFKSRLAVTDPRAEELIEKEMQVDGTGMAREMAAARAEAEQLLKSAGREKEEEHEEAEAGLSAKPGAVLSMPGLEEKEEGSVMWLHGHGLHSAVRREMGEDSNRGWAQLAMSLQLPMCRWVFPAGPFKGTARGAEAGGWFSSRGAGGLAEVSALEGGREEVGELEKAAEYVEGLVEEEAEEVGRGRVVLGGFGHGAVVALRVAERGRVPLAGLMLYAGWAAGGELEGGRLAGLKVLLGRGAEDAVVTEARAAELRERIERGGGRLCLREGEAAEGVGHAVELGREGGRMEVFVRECLAVSAQRPPMESPFSGWGRAPVADGVDVDWAELASAVAAGDAEEEQVRCRFELTLTGDELALALDGGSRVLVTGDATALGRGCSEEGVEMRCEDAGAGRWAAEVEIAAFSRVNYLYAIVAAAREVRERGGEARSFAVHRQPLAVSDRWDARLPTLPVALSKLRGGCPST